jgi:hypothetical protein
MAFDDWLVQQLRVSLFSSQAFPVSEDGWKLLTGQPEADNRVNVPGGRQYSGKLLGGFLALTITPHRLDIVLGFDSTGNVSGGYFIPVIGQWTDLAVSFENTVQPFLEKATTPITRMAFGANLLTVTPSRDAAYRALATLLTSVKVDVALMRELIFKINWPQESKVIQGLEINRISGWSSLIISTNLVQMGLTGIPMAQNAPNSTHAVSLELDHNTAADRTIPFENHHLMPIFRELITLAAENARSGERP